MNKKEIYRIYTLEHPITGEIRYVGQTKKSLEERLYGHCTSFKSKTNLNYREAWIKSLLSQELVPVIKLLEIVDENSWENAEVYWIAQFKAWGFRLVNSAIGGISSPLKGITRSDKHVSGRGVPVFQYSLEGKFIKEWTSATNAAKELDVNYKAIALACKKLGTSGGFQWRHRKDTLLVSKCTNRQNRKIAQYSLDNTIIKIWNSTHAILRVLKIPIKSVVNAIEHNIELNNYKWKYYDE